MLIGIDGDAYEIDEVNGVQKLVEDTETGRQYFALVVPSSEQPADVVESAASADVHRSASMRLDQHTRGSCAMIDAPLIAEMQKLAAIIAPEITQPLYVLVKPATFDMPDVFAVAISGPSVLLWDILKADGQFRGAGPMIIFSTAEMSRETALGTFAHELAHLVDGGFTPVADIPSTPETRAVNEEEMREWHDNPAGEFVDVPAWFPCHA